MSGDQLYPRDAAYLAARGIPMEDALRLGYRTVSRAADLRRPADHLRHPNPDKGQWFGKRPRFQGSALEIPLRAASGAIVSCQAVPAQPRIREGEPVKKESMPGARLTLHIPLGVGDVLNDPTIPLGWTESPLKADSITLAGQPTFGCCGVDGFKVRNGDRSEPLPELEAIPLQGRVIFLFNDSDLHTGNAGVQGAYERQCAYVTGRGGIPLDASPPPAADGSKQGPDDFLAAGGKASELVTLAITHLTDRRRSATTIHSGGAEPCPRVDCRATRDQLAELRELQRAEAKVLTGRSVPANRVGPYLTLLRRYWSDASPRLKHLAAEPGRPETWADAEPMVDANGWAHIPLQYWAKNELGYSYSMMLSARKELVATGLLEEIGEPAQSRDGATYEKTLIRPKGASSYRESVCALATVVKPASNWGGSRWECPNDPAHKVVTKHVCASCNVDAVLVTPDEPVAETAPDPRFQVENEVTDALPPDPQLWDTPTNTTTAESHVQLENRVPVRSLAPTHTYSAETENGPPATNFQVENEPGDGQDSSRVAAKAWGQSALDAAKQLNYPLLCAADGRTILVKEGEMSWAATCRAAPPNIALIATRITSALAEHERRYPL